MKRWTPFFLWLGLFWPVIAFAEFCWRQGAGGELFTDSEGIIPLILLIVWLVLLFKMRPDNSEDSEWDDDDEPEITDNTLLTVVLSDDRETVLSRKINLDESAGILSGRMIVDNDPRDPVIGTVLNTFQVLGDPKIVWRVNVSINLPQQFKRLQNSGDWDVDRISH